MSNHQPQIPQAPRAIQKGVPLKDLLGSEAIDCLAHNIRLVYPSFDSKSFYRSAVDGLEPLGLMERGQHLAKILRQHLPEQYAIAIDIILASLTPPLTKTDDNGLAVFFYLPHSYFVAMFGLNPAENGGQDPFEISMQAQYEITQRFSAEFSMRPFLIQQPERTLDRLLNWTADPNPHVRRLCSEATRPRLPWGVRIPAFIANPEPVYPILEALKCDDSLYVRRSVANHLGDIAKDHPQQVFEICDRWLNGATPELKWLIRHALRHPAKKGDAVALQLRAAAK
jgi:3-methyladenine DNA glycosylase AlkC